MISIACSVQTLLFSFLTFAIASKTLINGTLQTTVTSAITSTTYINGTVQTAVTSAITTTTYINGTVQTTVSSTIAPTTLIKNDTRQTAVNGSYSKWSKWSPCNVSCGDGYETHNRTCDNPAPQYGGANCTGASEEIKKCSAAPCPINGSYSKWNKWSGCNVTCGDGYNIRNRTCDNPAPQYGGENCTGESEEKNKCTLPCPITTKLIMTASLTAWGVLICIFILAAVSLRRKEIHYRKVLKEYNTQQLAESEEAGFSEDNSQEDVNDDMEDSHFDIKEDRRTAIPLLTIAEA